MLTKVPSAVHCQGYPLTPEMEDRPETNMAHLSTRKADGISSAHWKFQVSKSRRQQAGAGNHMGHS